jgi:hypothetical protein
MPDEFQIVSTWGQTTEQMKQIIRVARTTYKTTEPHMRAYREVVVRYCKCGEIIDRTLVIRVAEHYQADPEKVQALMTDRYYGMTDQLGPDFKLNPTAFNPCQPRPVLDEFLRKIEPPKPTWTHRRKERELVADHVRRSSFEKVKEIISTPGIIEKLAGFLLWLPLSWNNYADSDRVRRLVDRWFKFEAKATAARRRKRNA